VLLTVVISAFFLIIPLAVGSQYPKDPTQFTLNMLEFRGAGRAVSAPIAVPILSVRCATFFGADALVSEYESKTRYFLFPNPVRKTAIFLGKFVASALVSLGTIGLFYLIAAVSVRVIDGKYGNYYVLKPTRAGPEAQG
jgi:ABC-type transport system involved in multi-copper enzyme maturation permease subunit